MGVGAIEDGEALVGQVACHLVLEDAVGHHGAFLGVGVGVDEADEFAFLLVAPHLFLDLVLVVGDDGVRGVDDVLGGTVVLFQADESIVGVVVLEVEDVLDVGAAEGIDALGVVAYHADVLEQRRDAFHDEVLSVVGVLVLVDEDELESVLVFVEHIGVVAQEDVGEIQDVVEVHGVGAVQTVIVELEQFGDERLVRLAVSLLDVGVVGVVFGRVEARLGRRDARQYLLGWVHFGIETQVLEDLRHERLRVVGVIDGEVGSEANLLRLDAQDAGEDGVEGAHPHVAGLAGVDELHDAFLHLAGGFVGEGEGHDAEGVDAFLDHIGDAVGEGAGLARTGTGDHHHWAFYSGNGLSLRLVEVFQ